MQGDAAVALIIKVRAALLHQQKASSAAQTRGEVGTRLAPATHPKWKVTQAKHGGSGGRGQKDPRARAWKLGDARGRGDRLAAKRGYLASVSPAFISAGELSGKAS